MVKVNVESSLYFPENTALIWPANAGQSNDLLSLALRPTQVNPVNIARQSIRRASIIYMARPHIESMRAGSTVLLNGERQFLYIDFYKKILYNIYTIKNKK